MNKSSHTVLVIEDENLLLQAIATKFSTKKIETISCATAEQALDYLESTKVLPSAIWLDYYLKNGMSGLDFMQKIKTNDKYKNISIFVVSNSAGDDKVKTMLKLGAKKYYLKAEMRLEDIANEVIAKMQP